MHWVAVVKAVAATVSALVAWRWLIQPIRRGWRQLIALLGEIRASSKGVQLLALDVQGLAGAVTRLVVNLIEDNRTLRAEHEELRQRQADQADLILELMSDVRAIDLRRRATKETR